ELGAVLIERRRGFVERLGVRAVARHGRLGGGDERLEVSYVCAVGDGDERVAMRRALEARRAEEIRRATTLVGPHRDDLRLTINGVDMRMFGSRGQHHTAALSLRLAEALAAVVGPRRAKQGAVLEAWPEVVGASHARHTWIAGLRGSVLVVTTDLPALSYELGLRRAALVGALNRKAGGPAIDEIEIILCPPGGSPAGER